MTWEAAVAFGNDYYIGSVKQRGREDQGGWLRPAPPG